MKIEYTNYKGKQVETKTEQVSFLAGKPIFNFTDISIEEVPINKKLKAAFKILSSGDAEPFFFISEMKLGKEHKTTYGDIMTEEWAESFISKLDIAPFPMSALGHTNITNPMERVESHGYVLGGKVIDNSMVLKNYILPGQTPETKELAEKTIREMKAGMLSTSISNFQKYVLVENEETNEREWFVIESLTGQRNDIVEHDLTGSDAAIVARSMKSKAEESKSANKNKTGEQSMDKKEMLSKLSNLKQGGDLTIAEIVDNFGLELMTDESKSAVTILKSIQTELGEGDTVILIKGLKEKAGRVDEAEFKSNKSEALKETFKAAEIMLPYAEEQFALKAGTKEECVVEAKRIASLKTIKDLASKIAGDMSKGVSFKTNLGSENTKDDVLEM